MADHRTSGPMADIAGHDPDHIPMVPAWAALLCSIAMVKKIAHICASRRPSGSDAKVYTRMT